MTDSKHSKLSAMAADYYPTSVPHDFTNPMSYSSNYAFGAFHSAAAQLSPQIPPPFMLHSAPVPPFQSHFMYIRPAFLDGLPMNATHPFQPSRPDHLSADLPQNHFLTSNKQPHSQRGRPRSAPFIPYPHPQPTAEMQNTTSAAKLKKKKRRSKNNAVPTDLNDALAEVSLEDNRNARKATSSAASSSAPPQSYSDVLKRVPVQPVSKEVKNEEKYDEEEPEDKTLLNPIVEEFPSSSQQSEQRGQHPQMPSTSLQSKRGILHVSPGSLDSNNRSLQQSTSFKLDLATLTPDVPTQSRKQKSTSSSRSDRPDECAEQNDTSPTRGDNSATPKKASSVPEASPATSVDSPDRKPKYSKLKKVILEERKKRQQHEENDSRSVNASLDTTSNSPEHDVEAAADDKAEVSQFQSSSSKTSPQKYATNSLGNVCNSYLSSALSGLSKEDADAICRRLHRRRFREYCNQVLGAALDDATYLLLTTLGTFQQRQYEQNPAKAKLRRRYVCGLREAVKHIQLGKAKCIILAPNIERIPGKGGLDDMISLIISQCATKNVPVIFALGRVALGRACSKPSPVSSVAIISPAGADDKFKQTLELAQRAHESYVELVKMAVAEQLEQREQTSKHSAQPERTTSSQLSGTHVQFPSCHQMGHTRNASNISAISFISNVSAMSDNSIGLNNVPSTESADDEDRNNVPSCGESDKDGDVEDVAVEDDIDDFQEEDQEEADIRNHNDTL